MSKQEKSLLGKRFEAQFIYGDMVKEKKHHKTFWEQWKEDAIKYKEKKAIEEAEKEKKEQEEKIKREALLEKQRIEAERIMREVEAVERDRAAHVQLFEKTINPFTKLRLTKASFNSNGLEISAYISIDGGLGEIFTVPAKANSDGSAEFDYAGNNFQLSSDEVKALCLVIKDAKTEANRENNCANTKSCDAILKEALESFDGKFLFTIQDYLSKHGELYPSEAVKKVKAREKGEGRSLSEHVKAMIYAMLSNETKWENIEPNLSKIDKIFHDYDVEYIKTHDPADFTSQIQDIKCGNRNIMRSMEALKDNIFVFERLCSEYGSLDAFIDNHEFEEMIKLFSDYESEYKLKMMHVALVCEYLRNIGVDCVKPDRHLRRFLGSNRMGLSMVGSEATTEEVFAQVKILANSVGLYKVEIDNIIWSFCADGYGEVCTATPHRDKCPVKDLCRYRDK